VTPAELDKVLAKHALTLVYFSTPTCGVCRVLRPKVEALIEEVPPWYFQYVNTEDAAEIAGQHLIFTVPTILLMAEGKEVSRLSRHFGLHDLEQPIRRYAELIHHADS